METFIKTCDHCKTKIRGWEKGDSPYCSDECEKEAIEEANQ
jgi:hypothetical protein